MFGTIRGAIPASVKVTDVTWTGKGDASVFPNWQSCAVNGQDSDGYGGSLTCTLFGLLQPAGAGHGPSAAPTITLTAIVSPNAAAGAITNVVDYHTVGDPDDPGRDTDDAVVTVIRQPLPSAGAPGSGGCRRPGPALPGVGSSDDRHRPEAPHRLGQVARPERDCQRGGHARTRRPAAYPRPRCWEGGCCVRCNRCE